MIGKKKFKNLLGILVKFNGINFGNKEPSSKSDLIWRLEKRFWSCCCKALLFNFIRLILLLFIFKETF